MGKETLIMEVKYLDRTEIDRNAWNECVKSGSLNWVYAYFEYLDGVCYEQWGALVAFEGTKYAGVFPLPFRKKWGIYYVYQPYFCQQLGVFGNFEILQNHGFNTAAFLKLIPRKFLRVHLAVHSFCGNLENVPRRPNYVIPAGFTPDEFNKDARKNLKSLEGLVYRETSDLWKVLEIYDTAWGRENMFTWANTYEGFEQALQKLSPASYYAFNAIKNDQVIGAAIFLISGDRIHYVCGAPTSEGREIGIIHGIINHVCEKYFSHKIDLEGSSIPTVAQFYKKFNPMEEHFFRIEQNFRMWR
jgi:hypothetical protein